MKIDSYKKGYLRGSPDLIVNNLHKHYTGFAIEFKTPNGKSILSPDQSMMLQQCQNNGFVPDQVRTLSQVGTSPYIAYAM